MVEVPTGAALRISARLCIEFYAQARNACKQGTSRGGQAGITSGGPVGTAAEPRLVHNSGYTEYRNVEEELQAKEERIESAIHLINTLKPYSVKSRLGSLQVADCS